MGIVSINQNVQRLYCTWPNYIVDIGYEFSYGIFNTRATDWQYVAKYTVYKRL